MGHNEELAVKVRTFFKNRGFEFIEKRIISGVELPPRNRTPQAVICDFRNSLGDFIFNPRCG